MSKHEDKASRVLKARIGDPPPDGHGIKGETNSSFDLPSVPTDSSGNYNPPRFIHLTVQPLVRELAWDEFQQQGP